MLGSQPRRESFSTKGMADLAFSISALASASISSSSFRDFSLSALEISA
ncbi:MAG: hypothetical protein IJU70_02220 [Lentisphaeria bacterium]|nr:hypothetical protein [Lentisphaeria bacterium]